MIYVNTEMHHGLLLWLLSKFIVIVFKDSACLSTFSPGQSFFVVEKPDLFFTLCCCW